VCGSEWVCSCKRVVSCGSWTFLCVVCFGVLCICIDDYIHDLYIPVLTSETCWAVNWHNKASVVKLVYLYSNLCDKFVVFAHDSNRASFVCLKALRWATCLNDLEYLLFRELRRYFLTSTVVEDFICYSIFENWCYLWIRVSKNLLWFLSTTMKKTDL